MACETGLAALNSDMKRSDVNEVVKEILPKYEKKFDNPPLGKSFSECYDVKSARPTREYQ